MKKFLSLVLALVMTMSLVTISAGAKDFTDDSSIKYKEAVDVMSAVGIISGYGDGSFQPTTQLTRGAAAKIICNLILGPTTASALGADTAPFKDVPTNHTFAGYIAYCQKEGIISGYADGTFRPAAPLTGYAFMKMLLGALGYDASKEGYVGANWSINVAKQAINIGLNKGNDDFVGAAYVNREEAMLYAFNMLQADLVEYPNETVITTGDVTVTTKGSFTSVKWGSSADRLNNIKNDEYVQFAERYFNKLKKDASATDDFAQPATKWTYDGDKIGVYVDDAAASYTSNVELGTIYADLGLTQADKNAEVYYNGVQAGDVAVSRNNTVKIATKGGVNDGLVGDGSIVNVYYNSENNAVTICVIDVYAGEIASVNKTAADPYVMVTPWSSMVEKDNTTTVSGYNGKFETNDSFEEEQIVLFTYSQSAKAIKSVVAAESVEGTISKYVVSKSLTLGETEYKYAKNIAFGFGAETDMQTKGDYVVYTDANGLVIFVDEQEFNPTDYAFVLNAQTSGSAAFGKDQVKLVTATGKLLTVDTDDDYTNLVGKVVLYRAGDNGQYALRVAPNSYQNGNAVAMNIDANGKASTTAGLFTGGNTSFEMKNSNASVKMGANTYTDANGLAKAGSVTQVNTTQTYFANSETVFIVAETDANRDTTYSAYVGIKNAPTINPNGNDVESFYYVRGNNILAFVFIDAGNGVQVTSGKRDVVFLAGDEGLIGRVNDSDGTEYYLYNAVVGGEITTVKVAAGATNFGGVGSTTANYVLQEPDYNSKGVITGFAASLTGYTEYNQYTGLNVGTLTQGIWKLSGDYTIGIGGAKASDSIRLTVANNAEIFYVDTDGVITKLNGVKDIVSDTNDKVIALLDNTDGDVAYLFIQEVDSGNSETASGQGNTLSSISASYSLSNLSLTLNGTNAGETYAVSLKMIVAGVVTDMGTHNVTGAAGTTSATLNIGSLASGTYTVSCGGKIASFTVV